MTFSPPQAIKAPDDLDSEGMGEMNDYPSERFLGWIETYDVLKDGPCDLVRVIKAEWQWSDYIRWYPRTKTLKVSTGGWSGHESIMVALQKNILFFPIFWRATVAGGHYTFRLKEIMGCSWRIA